MAFDAAPGAPSGRMNVKAMLLASDCVMVRSSSRPVLCKYTPIEGDHKGKQSVPSTFSSLTTLLNS